MDEAETYYEVFQMERYKNILPVDKNVIPESNYEEEPDRQIQLRSSEHGMSTSGTYWPTPIHL